MSICISAVPHYIKLQVDSMLENHLLSIAGKLRLQFYRGVFKIVRERAGSLTAMEVFSLEIIHALGKPTVSEFADFIAISRPAASYKIASLIQKGYIIKESSEEDKREYRLAPTEKYMGYIRMYEDSFKASVLEEERKYSSDQISEAKAVLEKMDTAL